MTGLEAIMQSALSRLQTPTPFVSGAYGVRRSHRTHMKREDAPGAHLTEGDDRPRQGKACGERECDFTVSIFVRDDDAGAADPIKEELFARFADPWPAGVSVRPGRISIDTEIADGDACRVDCQFLAIYPTAGEWGL